jgi:UDP-2-acetamido-3-amino-2,3-dideoxy-glucuronate N-acetyltransferase
MHMRKLFGNKVKVIINIHKRAIIGSGTKIWENSQIREDSVIGENCNLGKNVYIGPGVKIGDQVKIQNNALIYKPAVIEDAVFIGPGVIFTNDLHPRAVNEDGSTKNESDWTKQAVVVRSASSIGAGAICVAPVTIGNWAMVAAGSVVVKNVPNFALVAGIPAKQIGWVGKSGEKIIKEDEETYRCPKIGKKYKLVNPESLSEL